MGEVLIRWARDAADVQGAIAVRERVFVQEQGVPVEEEVDGRDEQALHLVALAPAGGQVIGTLRLLFDGDTVKIGRVAVERDWRGQEIGARMLDRSLAEARTRGARRARLASQLDVVGLYERAGFTVESDVFEDAGIPHVWMGRQLTEQPALVIFDCDGVLVDSEPISNGVLAAMLGEQGWELSLAAARARFQGLQLSQVRAVAERALGRALPADWLEEYVRRRAEVFEAELAPVPGARELVEAVIGRGTGVCVASQGSLEKTARSLALTGLEPLFDADARFSANQVARGKPYPDLFLHAAATLGFTPPECAVVEDTPSGVTAAVAAGMSVYGFSADSDERALQDAGARTAGSLREIGQMLLAGRVDS